MQNFLIDGKQKYSLPSAPERYSTGKPQAFWTLRPLTEIDR